MTLGTAIEPWTKPCGSLIHLCTYQLSVLYFDKKFFFLPLLSFIPFLLTLSPTFFLFFLIFIITIIVIIIKLFLPGVFIT